MKVPIVLLAIGLISFSTTPNRDITLKLTNATLVKIFAKIERQTDYHFIYAKSHLLKARRVNIEVTEADINTVLDICLKDQNLICVITGNIIKVREKTDPLSDIKRIAGIVVDDNQQPIEHAEVVLQGPGKWTTNANGAFEVVTSPSDTVLTVTAPGYAPQRVVVGKATDLKIKMSPAF